MGAPYALRVSGDGVGLSFSAPSQAVIVAYRAARSSIRNQAPLTQYELVLEIQARGTENTIILARWRSRHGPRSSALSSPLWAGARRIVGMDLNGTAPLGICHKAKSKANPHLVGVTG